MHSTNKPPFRSLLLIIFTFTLLISAVLSSNSIQAQDGLIPLPVPRASSFTEIQVIETLTGFSEFGYSVSADEDLLVFGALPEADPNETEAPQDVALVYRRNGDGDWEYEATLYPSGLASITTAVADNTIMIGDTCRIVGARSCLGGVYFYELGASGWTQVAEFSGREEFGADVTLDGDLAATIENWRGGANGFVKGFARINGIWEALELREGVFSPGPDLTWSGGVDIHGTRMVAAGHNYDGAPEREGEMASVFERSGDQWNRPPSAYLSLPHVDTLFHTVDLSGDMLFLRTAFSAADSTVVVFRNNGGTWTHHQTLTSEGNADEFGITIAAEGNLLAVGNPYETPQGGAVYLYAWNGSEWLLVDKITDENPKFGVTLALTNGILFVGSAAYMQSNSPSDVYIYAIDDTPPTPEPTSEPTQEPTSDPTAEPTQDPTSDPTDEPTPVPPTSTPETTPDPTSEPTDEPDTQVLADGGFEQQLTNWTLKNASGDKLKCNKPEKNKFFAHTGACAFLFKGKPGENAKLQQIITSGVNPGSTLTLSGYVNAKGADIASKVKVVVKYADGVTPKSKITVNVNSATGGVYVPLSNFQPVLTTSVAAPVGKLKVTVKNSGTSGKVFYDALSLTAQ